MKLTYQKASAAILATLLLLTVAGCSLFGSDDPEPGTVQIELSSHIGGQPLVLNQTSYMSPVGHDFSVTLVEYILTNVALRDENGNLVRLADVHYCNEENPDTHVFGGVEVPAGKYTSLTFTFGVSGQENVFGNLANTTDFDNMMWPMMMPMGDGATERYHYMRFEGRYGVDGAFRIHVGPSGGSDFSFDVEVPLEVDLDGEDWNLGLVMNLDQWLTEPNDWDFADYSMIMGNQAAQSLIQANGASVFTLGHANVR